MRINRKKFIIIACLSTVIFAIVAIVSITALGKSGDKAKPSNKTEAKSVSNRITNFKKAPIEEYNMSFMAVKKTSLVNAQKTVKKDEVKDFSVPMPEDTTIIYTCTAEPMEYVDTRDISCEFYTVHDENTGNNYTLDAFDLVCRIVNNEVSDSWSTEAIKAQAVAAYSYVRYHDEHGITASVGLKAGYSGVIEDCVRAVSGQAVFYDGEVINAVYSASSAGYSAESGAVWGTGYRYLSAVESPVDKNDPHYGVEYSFTKEYVKTVIESKTDIKLSDDIRKWFGIQSVYSRKYIGDMTIDGYTDCKINGKMSRITGTAVQTMFGLKNNAFDIRYEKGNFVFTTYGWGHGVGMSQWGAELYAEQGYKFDQILVHYYIDTVITLSDVNERAVQRGATDSSEESLLDESSISSKDLVNESEQNSDNKDK